MGNINTVIYFLHPSGYNINDRISKNMDKLTLDEDEEVTAEEDDLGEVNIKEMLDLQISEVEMLQSMFPNPGEFKMDDASTLPAINAFLENKLTYDLLNNRVGFSVHITPESSKVYLNLFFRMIIVKTEKFQ